MKKVAEGVFQICVWDIQQESKSVVYRKEGGWAKTVTGIDRNYTDKHSLIGDIIYNSESGEYIIFEGNLYFDCDIIYNTKFFRLFLIENEEIKILSETTTNSFNDIPILWPVIQDCLKWDILNPLDKFNMQQLKKEIDRRKELSRHLKELGEKYGKDNQ